MRTVLAHYDEGKPLLISCDASPYGIGAVLSQPSSSGEEAPLHHWLSCQALGPPKKKTTHSCIARVWQLSSQPTNFTSTLQVVTSR